MSDFLGLKVEEKIHETEDSCSFILQLENDQKDAFAFVAGQYLTLKLSVNGEELRRAYSIFTPPHSNKFGFTVKRVANGKVSNFLIDKLFVGDHIDVMAPQGKFKLEADPNKQRDHYFISGGSGITPIMSMIESVLENEPLSRSNLLYCNRNENCIIFQKALEDLSNKYKDQISVQHILSQPAQEKVGGIKGLFGKKKSNWRGWKGRINNDILDKFLDENPARSRESIYYLCGPSGLIETAESFLKSKGTDEKLIKKEFFTSADTSENNAMPQSGKGDVMAQVQLQGEQFEVEIPTDKTILEALLDEGKDAPYSCTSGACSTCVAKVTEGEVTMDACFALDDDEIKDGFILTCQARVQSPTIKLNFDA